MNLYYGGGKWQNVGLKLDGNGRIVGLKLSPPRLDWQADAAAREESQVMREYRWKTRRNQGGKA